MIGASLAEHGFAPWIAMALPNVALVALSAVLVRKVQDL
jgi:hypothetical protein